jgi:hypothetical protein
MAVVGAGHPDQRKRRPFVWKGTTLGSKVPIVLHAAHQLLT